MLYAVVALGAVAFGRQLRGRVFWLAALAPLGGALWATWAATQLHDGKSLTQSWTWVSQLGLTIDLRADWFGVLMVFIITVIGVGVFIYAKSYFGNDLSSTRCAAALVLFSGAMFGLVLSDNLLLLFVFWELTSILSYVLIGTNEEKPGARVAALHALLVTGTGGLVMLAGFVLLGQSAGTYSLSQLLAQPPSGAVVNVAMVLIAIGAFTKSAQVPFHGWLPRAMEAPTPVSAYLHSATMVKAGVVIVARFAPTFADTTPFGPLVVSVGCATMLLGGWRALRQHDLKLLLAFGTISQLGFLMILFGFGQSELAIAGCVLLIAHAAFKASLFLVVGIVDHQTHTRDFRKLDYLGRKWPVMATIAVLAAASMAGVPPLLGFLSKELSLHGLLDQSGTGSLFVLVVVCVASVMTVAYSARFLWGTFFSSTSGKGVLDDPVATPKPRLEFWVVAFVLSLFGLVIGIIPSILSTLVDGAVSSLGFGSVDAHLALWSGISGALGLSLLILFAGFLLFVLRQRFERWQGKFKVPSSVSVYDKTVKGVLTLADRVTAVSQSGSLRVYLVVLAATMVVLPAVPLVVHGWPDSFPTFVDSPMQILIGAIMIAAAVAAAVFRRRFASVIALSVVGYGMAGLFVVQGAPDLALTQVLVETLGTVAFVLVMRHLPERFAIPSPRRTFGVIAVSVSVAVFVFWFVLSAGSISGTPTPRADVVEEIAPSSQRVEADPERTVSEEYLARSKPEAHGSNVVNVIVVDFRGFDTLGEITVLFVAAIGIVGLLRMRPRKKRKLATENLSGELVS